MPDGLCEAAERPSRSRRRGGQDPARKTVVGRVGAREINMQTGHRSPEHGSECRKRQRPGDIDRAKRSYERGQSTCPAQAPERW